MRNLVSVAAALGLALLIGCGKTTEPAKSPGAKTPPAEENTFTMKFPATAPNIEQGGEPEAVTVNVDRGENLKSEITLNFDAPKGVTIDPANPKIAEGESEVEVMVSASADAAPGEHAIKVTGEGDGKKASGTLNIEVTEPK